MFESLDTTPYVVELILRIRSSFKTFSYDTISWLAVVPLHKLTLQAPELGDSQSGKCFFFPLYYLG